MSDAHKRSKSASTENDADNIIWSALERALAAALRGAKELVIVVDGGDESSCGAPALLQRLVSATTTGTNVKLVALGFDKHPTAESQTNIQVTDDLVFDDITSLMRHQFKRNNHAFREMSEIDQEAMIERIADASKGTFLWAKLAAKRVSHETTSENLRKAVDALVKAKTSITDFVFHTIQSPDVTDDSRAMLLWLATAERPLLVKELETLASIQVDKGTVTDRSVDTLHSLKPLNSLVFLQNGQVYLRHGLIRTAVQDVFSKGKLVPTIKDRHLDLTMRLLIYIKSTVTDQREPSISPLNPHDTHLLVNRHPLLEFAIRYWPFHLRHSTAFTKGIDTNTVKELGKVFPTSPTVLLLQNTLWEKLSTPVDLTYKTTVTDLCQHIFTTNHVMTLQSIISLAIMHRDVNHFPEAISLFYEASVVSRTLLTTRHIVTIQMATAFLDLTTDRVTTSKTDFMVRREEVLVLLVECYKVYYGATSEIVVTTLKQLVEHYHIVKEEHKAQEIITSIQTITGGDHAGDLHDTQGDLQVRLRGRKTDGVETTTGLRLDVEEHDEQLLDTSETYDYDGVAQQARGFAAEGKLQVAERMFVEIWQRASREYRTQHSALWEERKMKAILAYSQFLHSQKRQHESSSILSSVWEEHRESSQSMSETSVSYFKEIAQMMQTVGLSSLALSVFKQCSHYYQSVNSTQSSSYRDIQHSIQATSQQVMHQASVSSSSISESTLEEMVIEASDSTKIDQRSLSATHSLVGLYVSQHRWKNATRLVKKILLSLWPSLFAPSIQDVTFPKTHVEDSLNLADRLSQCYHYRHRFVKEEGLRVRVYRAVRWARGVEDKLRERVTNDLLRFYERTSQTEKIITTRQELLHDYIGHYGSEHPIVIKTLWTLAKLTRPRPIFIEYYQQIIQALNKNSPVSHPDAFEPLVVVATELWSQGRYSDAVPYFSVIFKTFLEQPKMSPKLQDDTFVREIFTNYTNCLKSISADFSILHKVTVEYQTKCKTVFGATSAITVQSTLTLAKLCQESQRYEHEAISLYEELLNTKSEHIDLEEVSSVLDGIYEEQMAVSTKSESITSAQAQQAVRVLRKRLTSARETHGWAHEESLSDLRQMVSFHHKHNETETVVQQLKEAAVQIVSSESSSTRLFSSASTIAASYIESNQVHKATELTQELYRQIVMKETDNAKTVNFDLSSTGRQSLAFLAQLEHSLRPSSSGVTEILAALTTQYVYFEEFRSIMHSKSSNIHTVSTSAARLYHFLTSNKRQSAANRVFDEFARHFTATEGKRARLTETAQVHVFVLALLEHFSSHQSQNFVRSVGIASNNNVIRLLNEKKYDAASNLALASFKYISSHEEYRTPGMIKFALNMGMLISGRGLNPQPDNETRQKMLDISATIVQNSLSVVSDLKINVAQIGLVHLNSLIGILGEKQDYKYLAWLLTELWNNHDAQRNWQPYVTFALGRRFILARYLVGDSISAIRLAEDIVYNCRRVHGVRHESTLSTSILLSQLYTGVAQRYQSHKEGQDMANRYYKKSAAVHENIIRVFSDPTYAEFEGGLDGNTSMDGSTYDLGLDETIHGAAKDGEHVRQHLHLLKLAVQRLGDWPKSYSEYERLSSDVFREYGSELKGIEGVEKWDPKSFGAGKAQSNEDMLDLSFNNWELVDNQSAEEPVEEEEL